MTDSFLNRLIAYEPTPDAPPAQGQRPADLGAYQDAAARATGQEPAPQTPLQQELSPRQQPQQQQPGEQSWQPSGFNMPGLEAIPDEGEPAPSGLLNPYETAVADAEQGGEPESVEQRLEGMQQLLDTLLLQAPDPTQPQPFAQPYEEQPFAGQPEQQQPFQQPFQPQGPALPPIDPYDPESIQHFQQALPDYLAAREQHVAAQAASVAANAIGQQLAPIMEVLQTAAEQQGEQAAIGWFSSDEVQQGIGRFDPEQAYLLANSFVVGGADPQEAMAEAARAQHAFEKKLWSEWAAARDAPAVAVAQAPTAVPAAPAAATEIQAVPPGSAGYKQIADSFRGLRVVA